MKTARGSPAPFGFVDIDARRSLTKPRQTGLSMVIDDGLPLAYVASVLELAGTYIDLMKIKTGTARLYPREQLLRKLAMYEEAQVQPFLGGQFHEYVFATLGEAALPRFYDEALSLGFTTIEISDNTVPLTAKQRRDQIATAVASGLRVFGEVGVEGDSVEPRAAGRASRDLLRCRGIAGARGGGGAGRQRADAKRHARRHQARHAAGSRDDRVAGTLDRGRAKLRHRGHEKEPAQGIRAGRESREYRCSNDPRHRGVARRPGNRGSAAGLGKSIGGTLLFADLD